jgi:ABC-type branched-subunit amino acid transport system ATPase component
MHILQLNNISKSFGGVQAVKDFSMEIDAGEIRGIIGPNGAGKTTIFNLVSKVYDLDSGSVVFKDKDITKMSQRDVAIQGISRTFQNIRLFSTLSVLENVKAACDYKPRYTLLEAITGLNRKRSGEKLTAKEAMECLELVELDHYANERPYNLPYGLQRKLEIARALAMNPQLLLLDEPGAGLNPEEIFALVDFIQSIQRKMNISMIIIDHRMDIIMNLCAYIYVQDFGKNIAEGTPGEIQADPIVQAAYLGDDTMEGCV